MPNPFEGKPNADALAKKALENAQQSIDAVLTNKKAIKEALDAYKTDGTTMNDVFDAICSKLEEQVALHLLREHGVKIDNEAEAERIADYDPSGGDNNVSKEGGGIAEKAAMLDKLGHEYSGVNIHQLIKDAIGGNGGRESVERLQAML